MKVLVLGGDGFCGWPTALHLSKHDMDVIIVDNLSRRNIDTELGVQSLVPIATPKKRLEAWKRVSGKDMKFVNLDLSSDYEKFVQLLNSEKPDAVVHFAEQRAAPYSMKSPGHKRYTVNNNLNATHNVLCAIAETGLDIHVVHLGTMGVYGYGAAGGPPLPEGYLKVTPEGLKEQVEILHPAHPGSIYHLTKTQDALFFQYYAKNDELRITDLHQGIVWGASTDETALDADLANRFDYDGDYGTVLNRFAIQAALGVPLTVHGTGGQTRAFIHLKDTVRCVRQALLHPPKRGDRPFILNQTTESHRVVDLAHLICSLKDGTSINLCPNPRKEALSNTLEVKHHTIDKWFKELGFEMNTLKENLLTDVIGMAEKQAHRVDMDLIPCTSIWTKDVPLAKAQAENSAKRQRV